MLKKTGQAREQAIVGRDSQDNRWFRQFSDFAKQFIADYTAEAAKNTASRPSCLPKPRPATAEEQRLSALDVLHRCWAALTADLNFNAWRESGQLKISTAIPAVGRLVGRRSSGLSDVPGGDHSSSWNNQLGKPQAVVTQPYHLRFESLCEIVDRCRKLGIRCDLHDPCNSWHFPGHTMLVVFTKDRRQP